MNPRGGAALRAQSCLRRRLSLPIPCQIFTRMGQCYTFNSGASGAEPLTTSRGGAGNGLDILLDVQQEEYLPVWKPMGRRPPGGTWEWVPCAVWQWNVKS